MKALCALLAATLFSGYSFADLVEVDLNAPGDGLITRDTDTNLDWLDLTETVNVSFNAIVGGAGGWYPAGWRHATTAQAEVLMSHSAVGATPQANGEFTSNPADAAGAQNLMNLMGVTDLTPAEDPFGTGWALDGPQEFFHHNPFYQIETVSSRGRLIYENGSGTSANPQIGHWLIRSSPIPEPGTFPLFFGAAIAYAVYRCRRKTS